MAFTATPNFVGVPDFGLIHINPEEVAKAFQTYLDTASRLTGVSLDDINRGVTRIPQDVNNVNLVTLLSYGMKLFDAIVWLTAGRPESHPLQIDPTLTASELPSMHDIARSVFFCYFMLITQARYPVSRSNPDKPKIPNFLRVIMGLDQEQHTYVEKICSFEPQKFDPSWAKFISFRNFGQETLSRFGLGVAGYRMFAPFGLYEPKSDMPARLRPAFDFARAVARANSSWDVHPLTRNPNILKSRGNLNKNLSNLILEVFTDDQINEMVRSKVIFARPEHDPTHRNYQTWDAVDNITGTSIIFRELQQ